MTGSPPFKWVLKHHGWRVKGYNLPSPPAGVDDLVVAPAEVEFIADRVLCMHNGKVIASGTPDDVRHDETVQAVYLGRAVGRA